MFASTSLFPPSFKPTKTNSSQIYKPNSFFCQFSCALLALYVPVYNYFPHPPTHNVQPYHLHEKYQFPSIFILFFFAAQTRTNANQNPVYYFYFYSILFHHSLMLFELPYFSIYLAILEKFSN